MAEVLFRCPRTSSALRVAETAELDDLLKRYAEGTAQHVNGSPVIDRPESALVSDAGRVFYPVTRGIFCLLEELAIAMPGATIERTALDETKARVRSFYDELGWSRRAEGVFEDAALFEDMRPVSAKYRHRANERVQEALPPNGTYLLDVASGPIQYDDYVAFSEHYKWRVCVDLSLTALLRA